MTRGKPRRRGQRRRRRRSSRQARVRSSLSLPSDAKLTLLTSTAAVQCPICAAFVRPNHINPHLDSGCKSGIVSAAVEGSKSAFSALMSSSSKVGGGGKGGKAAPSSECVVLCPSSLPTELTDTGSLCRSEVEADLDTAKSLPLRSYDYKTVKNLIEMLKVCLPPPPISPELSLTFSSRRSTISRQHFPPPSPPLRPNPK